LVRYTNPSTRKPSFDGNVAVIVTSGALQPGDGYFNLSSVLTSTPSLSWQNASRLWRANQTVTVNPVETISAAVCSPKYTIESWTVDLINGSMTLIERQLQRVGNLDPTQLNITIQDSFVQLSATPPLSVFFGISILQIMMLFCMTGGNLSIGIPYSGQNLTGKLNAALPPTVQAYLNNFPFGNITRPDSQLLITTLVLSAQSNFVYTVTALYALLSASLIYLFTCPVAEPLTSRVSRVELVK
jgi:hypothetical protein